MQKPVRALPLEALDDINAALLGAQSTLSLLLVAGEPADGFRVDHETVTEALTATLESVTNALELLGQTKPEIGVRVA